MVQDTFFSTQSEKFSSVEVLLREYMSLPAVTHVGGQVSGVTMQTLATYFS